MSNHHTKFLILQWNSAEQGWNKAGTARNSAEQRGTRRRYPPEVLDDEILERVAITFSTGLTI